MTEETTGSENPDAQLFDRLVKVWEEYCAELRSMYDHFIKWTHTVMLVGEVVLLAYAVPKAMGTLFSQSLPAAPDWLAIWFASVGGILGAWFWHVRGTRHIQGMEMARTALRDIEASIKACDPRVRLSLWTEHAKVFFHGETVPCTHTKKKDSYPREHGYPHHRRSEILKGINMMDLWVPWLFRVVWLVVGGVGLVAALLGLGHHLLGETALHRFADWWALISLAVVVSVMWYVVVDVLWRWGHRRFRIGSRGQTQKVA